jgi:non-specific serine/threonine protein kinase
MLIGQLEIAERAGRDALRLAVRLGAGHSLAMSTECLAWIAAERRDAAKAAKLLGAASGVWKTIGAPLFHKLDAYHERCERFARTALGDERYAEERLSGELLLPSELVELAGSDSAGTPETSVRPWSNRAPDHLVLTPREAEIARLVAAGLTSKETAAQLLISKRTVEAHVGHVLAKLGLKSRIQLAHWVASQALLKSSVKPAFD